MTTTPTDAQMKLAIEMVRKVAQGAAINMAYKQSPILPLNAFKGDLNVILDAIQATEARAQGLVEALTASALRFREYEASHAAKGNLDGDAKARRNCEMAEQCEQALATWRRT